MPIALMMAGVQGGMSLLGGLMGFLGAEDTAAMAESRGRMIRAEADADAQRYAERAQAFKATQKVAFLKNGVTLSGSPLDVLARTARVAQENISAIRARGAAGQFDQEMQATQAGINGRNALIGGMASAIGGVGSAYGQMKANEKTAAGGRNDISTQSTMGTGLGFQPFKPGGYY